MIRIRPFTDSDEEKILTWCADEETFYMWTFGLLGEFPLDSENFKIIKAHAGFTAVDDGATETVDGAVDDSTADSGKANSPATKPVAANPEPQSVGYFIIRNPGGALDELRFGYGIVDPERRCEGIGKAMLSAGLTYAFDVYGAKRVTLGVYENNRIGYNCYKAIGFRETGKIETYTVRGEELRVLEMEAVNRRPQDPR